MYRLVVLCFTLFVSQVQIRASPIYAPSGAISHQSRVDVIESKPLFSYLPQIPQIPVIHDVQETPVVLSHHIPEVQEIHETPVVLLSSEEHQVQEIHETPLVLEHIPEVLETHETLLDDSEEIHSVLSAEDHEIPVVHNFEGIVSDDYEEHIPEIHEAPVVLPLFEDSGEIQLEDHEHFPEHIGQISVSSHSIHQSHDSPASTYHLNPVVLHSEDVHFY